MAAVHVSPYTGAWYPGDALELRGMLDRHSAESARRTGSFLLPGGVAFVVPHAAPQYSGTVAAAVYRHLAAAGVRRVMLLGFSHSQRLSGVSIPGIDSYSTPLGNVEVDRPAAAQLLASAGFYAVGGDAVCDHSV
ncbi:MAG: AmmeMemoRadiSam system protein B, partial [Bryobacteraceae bacterium]